MSLLRKNFWCHILRRPTNRVSEHSPTQVLLAQSKVRQFDVTFLVHKHVLRLEVPINDAKVVNLLQRNYQLRSVKPNNLLRERLILIAMLLRLNVSEQLATSHELHNKVKLVLSLKRKLHVYNEWRMHLGKDLALSHNMLYLFILNDVVLLEHLHRVVSLTTLLLD